MTLPALTPMEATAACGLLFACYTDIRWWRIPNVLNLVLIVLGFALNAVYGDVRVALLGFGAAFVIHYGLWALGVQKGGDAKLMIGIGALIGWDEMLEMTFWKLILLVPVGLIVLAATGKLQNVIAAAKHTLARARGEKSEEPPQLTYMPFAPVIAVAGVVSFLTDWIAVWR